MDTVCDKIQRLKVRLELQATLAAHDACRREILQKPSNFDGKKTMDCQLSPNRTFPTSSSVTSVRPSKAQ